ncbi:MAG: DUF4190 domain-containing protein [Tepidisphaeraceae bacterium]|jgi:hypothetical protein
METCENCGATIGNLETPSVFQNHVVCSHCHAKLAALASTSTDELKSADFVAILKEAARAHEQPPAFEISRLRGSIPDKKNPDGSYQGMALTAMILSIGGLFCFGFITGVIAIIFGGIALSGMSRTGNKDGQGMAITGIVLGAIDFAGWLIWLGGGFG